MVVVIDYLRMIHFTVGEAEYRGTEILGDYQTCVIITGVQTVHDTLNGVGELPVDLVVCL